MLKQSVKTVSILAALLSMHSVASATCKGADCKVDVQAEVEFDSSYYLSPNHKGIIIQSNVGNNTAVVDLQNVVMRNNGNIEASAQAIGNNVGVQLSKTASTTLRHVSQSNKGNQLATVELAQNSKSVTGEVVIEAMAVGNNFSLTLDNTSLAELSVAQCNVGNNIAAVEYKWDPTRLTASATSVGNNISVGGIRP